MVCSKEVSPLQSQLQLQLQLQFQLQLQQLQIQDSIFYHQQESTELHTLSHAPTSLSSHLHFAAANFHQPFSSFEIQFPGLQYPPASSIPTPSAGSSYASYSVAIATTTNMPQKRPLEDEGGSNGLPVKHIKSECPEDFSKVVAKKLKDSNRTGQACDRCKVRKIRCDIREGGCTPCEMNKVNCVTTDRISGKSTPRGHVEALERENGNLHRRVRELERQLGQTGGDCKPLNGYQNGGAGYDYKRHAIPTWSAANAYPPQNLNGTPQQETTPCQPLPAIRAGTRGSNYLGVSPGNSSLSAIKGTALTILGMKIDIADFESGDMDEPKDCKFNPRLYNKSYQSFLQTALNVNPKMQKPELPTREDGFKYAEWYFRALNPYTPILHRPTFMALLERVYDDSEFRPTTAEQVLVHMVFAIMFFHFSIRKEYTVDVKAAHNRNSNKHYHYSLGMFYQLSCGHTFQGVQAMTLICIHLRNFPKPGASWILTETTLSLAIEIGLQRSTKQWVVEGKPNLLDTEMRKRTFWILLAINVTLSGKLGRPMRVRCQDIDVEFPEPMDDERLTGAGYDTSTPPGVCRHEIGLAAMRVVPLFIELYATIYAVRRCPENYIPTVRSLEAKIESWRNSLPLRLQIDNQPQGTPLEFRPFALYAEMWALEFRLLLRHPSVETTDDTSFKTESMKACVLCADRMLEVVFELRKFSSLDSTWYNSAVYAMALTTTLFAIHEKKDVTPHEIAALRTKMGMWLVIMGDVGHLLGSGDRLKDAVHSVIDGTLGMLGKRVAPPPAAYMQNSSSPEVLTSQLQRSNSGTAYANMPQYGLELNSATNGQATTSYPQGQMGHRSTPYSIAMQYSTSYAESPGTIAYTSPDNSHAFTNYPPGNDGSSHLAELAIAASRQQNDQWGRVMSIDVAPGHADWQYFAHNAAKFNGHVDPQDRHSATTLMSLNGRSDSAMAMHGVPDNLQNLPNLQPAVTFGQAHMSGNVDLDSDFIHPWPPINMNLDLGMLGNPGMGPG